MRDDLKIVLETERAIADVSNGLGKIVEVLERTLVVYGHISDVGDEYKQMLTSYRAARRYISKTRSKVERAAFEADKTQVCEECGAHVLKEEYRNG